MSASIHPNLCDTFRELAAWTCNKLGKADGLGMAFNEETVTESLLLKLAERHAGRDLDIRAYSKIEEGRGAKSTGGKPTGADWSFWFSDDGNKGIELRIQAKRLFKSGKYDSFHGWNKQFKDLKKNRGTAIPLYVFYNGSLNLLSSHIANSQCCCYISRDTDWGCTYAPLTRLPKKNRPSPSEIELMRPWHTLVCELPCPFCSTQTGGLTDNLPQKVAKAIKNIYAVSSPGKGRPQKWTEDLSFSANNSAPGWVELLREGESKIQAAVSRDGNGVSALDVYLKEHSLRGVVVISELPKQP